MSLRRATGGSAQPRLALVVLSGLALTALAQDTGTFVITSTGAGLVALAEAQPGSPSSAVSVDWGALSPGSPSQREPAVEVATNSTGNTTFNDILSTYGQAPGTSPEALAKEPVLDITLPDGYDMIVVLKDNNASDTQRLLAICTPNATAFASLSAGLNMDPSCNMPDVCVHVYQNTIKGLAGHLTDDQLQQLENCLPGAVAYKELDVVVHKSEDTTRSYQCMDGGGIATDPLHVALLAQETQAAPNLTTAGFSRGYMTYLNSSGNTQEVFQAGLKTQSLQTAQWNLDRIDQRDLPLDHKYNFGTQNTIGTGRGVRIYALDSGVLFSHQEFLLWSGGQTRARNGYDFIDEGGSGEDCDGHGTHTVSSALGRTVGVAKEATVVSVRVLDCDGSGTVSDVVAGLDWVAKNYQPPAIVTLSLGITVGNWSRSMEDAVRSIIMYNNVTVITASGNSQSDACYISPANVPETICVSASDYADKFTTSEAGDPEEIYSWSNTGPCVDIFAPGVDILGACGSAGRCVVLNDSAYTWASGTSMAVPHAAGVAAIYLGNNPQAPPAQVKAALLAGGTQNQLQTDLFRPGTPNLLLYSLLEQPSVTAESGPSSG